MGELLRAVLDASCIDSRPAFYTAQITTTTAGGGGATIFGPRSTVLECKSDTWFLMMSYGRFLQDGVAASTAALSATATGVSLSNLKRSQPFENVPTQQYLLNSTLNNCRTMDEYVLWEPGNLIGVSMDCVISSFFAQEWYQFVVLAGIEYKMPEGRDWLNGQG